jgi:hypothetical protein
MGRRATAAADLVKFANDSAGKAGTKAIIAIDDQLFEPGYPGKVVLST